MAFSDVNVVVVVGRLVRDIELKYTPSGTAVANFSIANNKPSKKVGDSYEEQPANFLNIVVWGKMAETCSQYLKKGKQAIINGRLQQRSYETNEGQKRSVVEVVTNSVQFVGGQSDRNANESANKSSSQFDSPESPSPITEFDSPIDDDMPPF